MSTLPAVTAAVMADTFGMHDGDMGVGWFVVMVLFWGLVVVGVVWLVRNAATPHPTAQSQAPLDLLKHRLASGEISVEEFKQREAVLGGGKADEPPS